MAEYISREAAIEIAMQYCPDDDGSCSKALADLRDMLDEIESIPAADVRPVVRGKWIPVGLDDADEGMFKCSECGSEHFFPEILLGIPADNFCPECGADMRPQPPKEEAG